MNINIANMGASFRSSNANAINPHANKISPTNQNNKEGRFDSVDISPAGKANNMMKNLMDQKEMISEQKGELVKTTLENGGSMNDIQDQLENYELQLENIDKQVADIFKAQVEETTEDDKVKKPKDTKPKTEEEIQNAKLTNISNMAGSLENIKTVSKVKSNIDGRSKVLETEIKLDKSYSSGLSQKGITKKEGKLADLQEKSAELSVDIGKQLVSVQDKIVETNKESTESIKEPKPSENTITSESKSAESGNNTSENVELNTSKP